MNKTPWVSGLAVTFALGTALAFAAYAPVSAAQERGGQERGGQERAGAQRGAAPRGGQQTEHGVGNGHIPAHGPTHAAAPKGGEANHEGEANRGGAQRDNMRRSYSDQQGHPEGPHVHAENDRWVGHEGGDAHYHLDHPWEHGHFPGTIGARHVWRLHGGRADRFGIGGFFFSVAPYDVGFCADWNWDDDDIVLYDDPDDAGWYLAYNVRLGTYCHVMYLGQ